VVYSVRVLRYVDTGVQNIDPYAEVAGDEQIERLKALAAELRHARILQLNATSYGGGVAELLNSLVPMEKGLGLDVRWGTIVAEASFFAMTKRLHNALQGATLFDVTPEEREAYIGQSQRIADAIAGEYDIVIVHDPQPSPVRSLLKDDDTRWVWRVHIDLSQYNRDAWRFLEEFVAGYDAFVFTLPEFKPEPLDGDRVHCFAPGIDPLSPKNLHLPDDLRDRIVRWIGVALDRPLMTQVSRFDPWKDPLGVVRVYRELRQKHQGLQLALLGSMALDDPEGWSIHDQIMKEVDGDDDIHVASNFTGIGNIEVNSFQSRSDVVIQKSVREGFGLVVSETLWKGTPVVAGRTGGIPLQMADGEGGFLVAREEDWIPRLDQLLSNRDEARASAARGRERVRERFLITRLLEDELRLLVSLRKS
jgi:trehalose synthase